MSLCDSCARPGACCDDFVLYGSSYLDATATLLEATVYLASNFGHPSQLDGAVIYPFVPVSRGLDGRVSVTCPLLDRATGRCSEYQYRPDTCRNFEAGLGGDICVHYARGARRLMDEAQLLIETKNEERNPLC